MVFVFNWLIAPGRLLARDVTREVVCKWLSVINAKAREAGRLVEAIRSGHDIAIVRHDFELWRESTRRFFIDNIPLYEPIFDDVESGPFSPLLDLPARLRAVSPPGFRELMESQPANTQEALIDMIRGRQANLQRIYEGLLPITISGNPGHPLSLTILFTPSHEYPCLLPKRLRPDQRRGM
jgi:hypothetical protein